MGLSIKGMKKLLLLVMIVPFVLTGCVAVVTPSNSDFVVEVTGTAGQKFSGCYDVMTSRGSITSKSVDGTVPAGYNVNGATVTAVFQKTSEGGRLKVEIKRGGKVVAESETTAAYGGVTASTPW